MEERRNAIADALELPLSCTNPAIYAQTRLRKTQRVTELCANKIII